MIDIVISNPLVNNLPTVDNVNSISYLSNDKQKERDLAVDRWLWEGWLTFWKSPRRSIYQPREKVLKAERHVFFSVFYNLLLAIFQSKEWWGRWKRLQFSETQRVSANYQTRNCLKAALFNRWPLKLCLPYVLVELVYLTRQVRFFSQLKTSVFGRQESLVTRFVTFPSAVFIIKVLIISPRFLDQSLCKI